MSDRAADQQAQPRKAPDGPDPGGAAMKDLTAKRGLRCAIYTRVSTDQGLEQDFNSLDAQREASEAYIKSQAREGWRLWRM